MLNDPVNLLDLDGLAPFKNSSSRNVVVTGTIKGPDGRKRWVTTEVAPGQRIDVNNPDPRTGLTDVDAVDFNGDGIADRPQNDLDAYVFGGEKIFGGSSGLGCEVFDHRDGITSDPNAVVPVPGFWVSPR